MQNFVQVSYAVGGFSDGKLFFGIYPETFPEKFRRSIIDLHLWAKYITPFKNIKNLKKLLSLFLSFVFKRTKEFPKKYYYCWKWRLKLKHNTDVLFLNIFSVLNYVRPSLFKLYIDNYLKNTSKPIYHYSLVTYTTQVWCSTFVLLCHLVFQG